MATYEYDDEDDFKKAIDECGGMHAVQKTWESAAPWVRTAYADYVVERIFELRQLRQDDILKRVFGLVRQKWE